VDLEPAAYADPPGGRDPVLIQLIGAEKHRPQKGERIFLYTTGILRDLDAHEYTDDNLRRLLHSKAILADDKIRYLEVSVSGVISLDTIQRVSRRIRKLADRKGKTVVTITFSKILIGP
jgi:hypothetical protein